MADISTGMKVTGLSQYKSAMQQAQQSVKTLDAQLKKTEAQYKATGDKEQYMSDKSDTLKKKLNEQQKAVNNAQKALDQMKKNGVDPASTSFQKMEQQLLKAQTGVLQTTTEINNLTVSEQEAAKGADQLTTSVNGISKKISLDQVISGVNAITTGLENAAKNALNLGKAIADAVLESAARSDNIATMASILGMDIEDYQRYQKVFDTVADITVTDWRRAQDKIRKAMTSPTNDQATVLTLLGIDPYTNGPSGKYGSEKALRDVQDVFWDIGMALRRDVASGKLTMLEADDMANVLFGKNWANLNPLFDNFTRETFAEALKNQNVQSEESVKRLADLNDTVIKLKGDFQSLQDEVLSGMAPALTSAANTLDSLLGKLMAYIQSEDGQKLIESLSESISTLFDDLGKIEPESVVESFTSVFNSIVESFKWLVENKDGVIHALEGIVIGWAGLKLTGGALQLYKLVSGLQGLSGGLMNGLLGGGAEAGAGSAGLIQRGTAFLGGKLSGLIGAAANGVPIMDWFWNETFLGQNVRNTGDIGGSISATFEKITGDIADNFRTFAADWRGVAEEVFTDPNKQASNMALFDPDELQAEIDALFGNKKVEIPSEPEVSENAAEDVAKQVGIVTLPAHLRIMGGGIGLGGGGANLQNLANNNKMLYSNANGLPFVPWDGYVTMLHRGERVLTASANKSYTANSNLYVENMNMNNGMDAQALAAAMNAQNQRIRSGFGS